MHSRPFTSLVLWHGTDSPFPSPFVVVCLQYGERSRRLPLVKLGVEKGLAEIRLLQAASSPLYP